MARGKGEGTFYKRADGTWCGQVDFGRDPGTGKRIRKTVYGRTKKEAREKSKELKGAINSKRYTLEQWMLEWLEVYKKPKLKETTYESYKFIIKTYINKNIGKLELKNIKPVDLLKFLNKLVDQGLTRSVKYSKSLLGSALKQAYRNGLININPVDLIDMPRIKKPKKDKLKVLSKEQQSIFEKALKGEVLELLFMTALYTGMRRGELLGLKWDHIDWVNDTITVCDTVVFAYGKKIEQIGETKTDSGQRVIPLPANLKNQLKAYRKLQAQRILRLGSAYNNKGYVFASKVGTALEDRTVRRALNRITEKANLPHFTPHTLRHTYGTRMMEAGVPAPVTRDLMGHSDIRVTLQIYTHTTDNSKAEAMKKMLELMGK